MIKLFKFFLLIVSPLFCLNALAHQLTINISASIIARSCEIANDTTDFTVNMETGNLKQSAIGVPFVETPFSIKLQNCPESVKIAHIKFTGNSDMSMPDYIQTTTETGSAKGVAIGLYDKNKTNISILNGTTDFTIDSTLPENTLSFIAAYVRTSNQFSSGTVTAVANFELSYD